MSSYIAEALDAKGLPVLERLEADSIAAAVRALRERGLYVYKVTPEDFVAGFRWEGRPLRTEELGQITEQLAALTKGGMPLAPALGEIAREVRSSRLRRVVEDTQRAIEQGRTLEEAFSLHPGALPPVFISLLRVGERSGNLPAILVQLSEYSQRVLRLHYRLQVVLAYPLLLAVFLLCFVSFFVATVMGQFENMYSAMGRPLPAPTRMLLTASEFIAAGAIPLMLGAILAALVLLALARFTNYGSAIRTAIDTLRLRTPLIGPMYRAVATGRFLRVLGMLLGQHAPIVESLHLAGIGSGSPRFAAAAMSVAAQAAHGECISESLQMTGLLRPSVCWMLKQGENNGDFVNTLIRVAGMCDQEAERREQQALGVLGPGIIITLGVLIGMVVIAAFMPIFQLTSLTAL